MNPSAAVLTQQENTLKPPIKPLGMRGLVSITLNLENTPQTTDRRVCDLSDVDCGYDPASGGLFQATLSSFPLSS